jgi:hypothetical protein
MAKGQKKSNKEIRKPKQDKSKSAPAASSSSSPIKIIENAGFGGKKTKK